MGAVEVVGVEPKTYPPLLLFYQNLAKNGKIGNIGFQFNHFVPRTRCQGRGFPDRYSYTNSIQKEGVNTWTKS